MKQRQSDAQVREEFFNDMERLFQDKPVCLEMVCLEADDEVFAALNLVPTQKHAGLWGLLICGEKNLHFYAHPSESAILGLFRAASNGKPPAEQCFSFSAFKKMRLKLIEKRGLFGKTYETYRLAVDIVTAQDKAFTFYLRTQNKARFVFEKLSNFNIDF